MQNHKSHVQADVSVFTTTHFFFILPHKNIIQRPKTSFQANRWQQREKYCFHSCSGANLIVMAGTFWNLPSHCLISLSLLDERLIALALLICCCLDHTFFFINADSFLSVITLFMAGSRRPNKPPSCFLFIIPPLPWLWSVFRSASPVRARISSGEPGLLCLPVLHTSREAYFLL